MLLNDRVVLITGASRGIGQGIARAAALEGARLVITDRRRHALEETKAMLETLKTEAIALEMDVTDEQQIASTVDRVQSQFGRLDGLVNNAGLFLPEPSLDATWKKTTMQFDVNVFGLLACCRAVGAVMKEQPNGGKIVNIASNAGKVGFPGYAAYSASKAAVINLTQTLAREWAEHRINLNAVCPGGVATPMLRSVAEDLAEKQGGSVDEIYNTLVPPQLGRHVRPLEIGQVVAFLLSDHATIIRGQSISIDGGETPY